MGPYEKSSCDCGEMIQTTECSGVRGARNVKAGYCFKLPAHVCLHCFKGESRKYLQAEMSSHRYYPRSVNGTNERVVSPVYIWRGLEIL